MSPTTTTVDYSLFGGADSLVEGKKQRAPWFTPPSKPTPGDNGVTHLHPPQDPRDFLWLMTEEPHCSRRMDILETHPEVPFRVTRPSQNSSTYSSLGSSSSPPARSRTLCDCIHSPGSSSSSPTRSAAPRTTTSFSRTSGQTAPSPYSHTSLLACLTLLRSRNSTSERTTSSQTAPAQQCTRKIFFATFQILLYALRPTIVRPIPVTRYHFFTVVVQVLFNAAIWYAWGGRAIAYFILSSFFAGSLHPCAGHFIAEHYVWDGSAQETYSYYGPLNVLAYNVGTTSTMTSHPCRGRASPLRALAPEFYDTLPAHPSWVGVIVNFLCDAEVGIYARVKCKQGLRMREALALAGKAECGSKIIVCEEDGEESDKSA